MKKMILTSLFVFSFAIGALPVRAQDSGPSSSVQAIRGLEQRFIAAVNAKDVKGIMDCFVSGSSLLVFDLHLPLEYRGAPAFTKDWEDAFAATPGPVSFQISNLRVTAGRNVAYATYINSATGKNKNGEETHHIVRVTHCYRKIGGRWLIDHEHVSLPVDLATGKAVFQSQP